MLTVSAPGKLLLFGEHAVVYGYPCIVTAVSERLTVMIEKTDGSTQINAGQTKDTRFIEAAIRTATLKFGTPQKGFEIITQSGFSGTYGLGSSSAVTIATLFALITLFGIHVEKRAIFEAAYQTVLDVQGIGSGFDVAAATYGGTLYFQRGGEKLEEVSIDQGSISFIVGYSGVKGNTVEMVGQVAEKKEKYPERVERIFSAIGKIVDDARTAIEEKDWQTVGKFMNFNQEYLRDLGVSTEKLETLIGAAKKAGAYGAKLSGAGGGDCMITLSPPEKKHAVEEAIISAGGQVIPVTINEVGVRLE